MRTSRLETLGDLDISKRQQVIKNRIAFAIIDCRRGLPPLTVIEKYESARYGLSRNMIALALKSAGIAVRKIW